MEDKECAYAPSRTYHKSHIKSFGGVSHGFYVLQYHEKSEHAYLNSRYLYMSKLATPSSCGSKKVGSQTTLRQHIQYNII